ncbi:hypothetical protein CMO95_02825 [Candidatus Woesearchaeota archaeon]|nr:hypothetical protein [Candidatus Woesearchaeota archaeon]|tara:strand:+ start:289 stop:558 length:270 start_codon:yes stop_codon:yes gene_type:complete
MAIITTYPVDTASSQDYLLGTKKSNTGTQINPTKNFTVESVVNSVFQSLPAYADNAAAVAGGLAAGKLFQTTGTAANPLNVAGIVMIVQ